MKKGKDPHFFCIKYIFCNIKRNVMLMAKYHSCSFMGQAQFNLIYAQAPRFILVCAAANLSLAASATCINHGLSPTGTHIFMPWSVLRGCP